MTIRGDLDGGSRRAQADEDADTDDELAGEDAKLRAMRSVWLAMRDEEPSSGGLAELLAAARSKADELAPRPTLWHRLVAGLRRPPVFAFATVLVLLGGALVVGRHAKDSAMPVIARDEAPRSAAASRGAPPPATGHAPAVDTPAVLDSRSIDTQATTTARPSAAPASPEPVGATLAQPATAAPGAGGFATPVAPRQERLRPSTIAPADTAPARPRPPARRPAGEEDKLRAGPSAATDADAASPDDAVHTADQRMTPPPPPAAAPPSAPESNKASAAPAPGDDRAPTQPRSGPTPPALYRQCEAAAARGDCADVRRLVDQISATDAGYRARIAKGSRIATCLAP